MLLRRHTSQEMSLAGKTVRISHPIIEMESHQSTWTFENIAFLDRDFILQTGGDICARNMDNVRILLALVHEYFGWKTPITNFFGDM